MEPRSQGLLGLASLKQGILLFWAGWLSLVLTTNVLDALRSLGVLPATWSFASGNFPFMLKVTSVHGTPSWLVALLFGGVIAWEALAAAFFWRAFNHFRRAPRQGLPAVHSAFTIGLALWAAFVFADEVFMAYDVEAVHLRLFTSQLVSLLALRLLPDED